MYNITPEVRKFLSDIGRIGGKSVAAKYGKAYFARIGYKGGKKNKGRKKGRRASGTGK